MRNFVQYAVETVALMVLMFGLPAVMVLLVVGFGGAQ